MYTYTITMKRALLATLTVAVLLPGCFATTRTETERHTLTERDTTVTLDPRSAPGDRDNGVVYPSPTTTEVNRRYQQRDSIVTRDYPAFLRMGGIETASFLTLGSTSAGSGNGLFGLYDLLSLKQPGESRVFGASMYRLMPYEIRLRWLHDMPDWTIGTAAAEIFVKRLDSNVGLSPGGFLVGVLPVYLRKRYYLRREIPYVMVQPFFGVGLFPSQYVNLGATLDVGSYGGMNLRAYLGYATGSSGLFNSSTRRRIDTASYSTEIPYVGIGISVLDFVNTTEELFVEWKDHKHSALEVSVLNVDLVHSLSPSVQMFESSAIASTTPPVTGAIMHLGSANYPLPIGERRLFVGTSLFQMTALSATEVGFGFLPIRVGYRFDVLYDELNLEPFAEFTYYPSTIFNMGLRLSLPVLDRGLLSVTAGYASGTPFNDVGFGFESLGADLDWSAAYFGVGIGIGDVFHTPAEVTR